MQEEQTDARWDIWKQLGKLNIPPKVKKNYVMNTTRSSYNSEHTLEPYGPDGSTDLSYIYALKVGKHHIYSHHITCFYGAI